MIDIATQRQAVLPDGLLILTTQRLWTPAAPAAVRAAQRAGDAPGVWSSWREHLLKQDSRRGLKGLAPGSDHPLFWALPGAVRRAWKRTHAAMVHALLENPVSPLPGIQRRLTAWLAAADDRDCDLAYAFEALAWGYALPRLAGQVAAPLWWRLLEHLLRTARHATHVDGQSPLVEQLLGGELSLTLAAILPEISVCQRMAGVGRRTLASGRKTLALGCGLPHARHREGLRTLLACWTRSRMLDGQARTDRHYALLLRNALRLTRPDGTQTLCDDAAGEWNPQLFTAALAICGSPVEHRLAAERLPERQNPPSPSRSRAMPLPAPSLLSREGATAILRTHWDRHAAQLSVSFADTEVQLELASGTDVICSGAWQVELAIDGTALAPVSPWHEIGWVSDKGVDYLELELCLQAGVRVQRHLLLARTEGFLYLADAVLGAGPGKLDYRARLPLMPGCKLRPAWEGRECFLEGPRRLALVMPLALPEWRAEPACGDLRVGRALELRQQSTGPNLFAPLFFDLDRRRITRPFTWRRLTVGQDRKVLPADQAVGYRVQSGDQQWLLYRSLVRPANRTVLGHNLVSETLVGRFTKQGLVESLLEIEVAQTGALLPAEHPHTRPAHIGHESA